jgi:hypothetical protein
MQQLSIFDDGRDQMLRNDLQQALAHRDTKGSRAALQGLAEEFPDDSALAPLSVLVQVLERPVAPPFADAAALRAARSDLIRHIEPAARAGLGATAAAKWLKPCWSALARAAQRLPYSPASPQDHAAPLWLHAGDAAAAITAVSGIASWRRIPAPLAWMAQARHRHDGLDAAWPLLAELAWLAPARLAELMDLLGDRALTALRRRFDDDFDAEVDVPLSPTVPSPVPSPAPPSPPLPIADDADDIGPAGGGADDALAWFPAWVLTDKPALAIHLELAQPGLGNPAEQGARLVLELLRLERAGRHDDLIARRRVLRSLHGGLFAAYMKSR